MSYSADDLLAEAQETLDKIWFVQSLETGERTDAAISLRLHIRPGLFVHAFLGELTGSLYFALIEGRQRIFGIDREGGEWHRHPYQACHEHEMLPEGLGSKPLLQFLSQVESVLLENDLL